MVEGRFRWRTRIRRHLPWVLVDRGVAGKPASDCGEHDWYNADGRVEQCYHRAGAPDTVPLELRGPDHPSAVGLVQRAQNALPPWTTPH